MAVVLGSMPNFGAGLGLPFVLTATSRILNVGHVIRSRQAFPAICLGVVIILVLWEYAQLLIWSIPADSYDLLASGVGAALAALFARWSARQAEPRQIP